jgi:hypothetical protein
MAVGLHQFRTLKVEEKRHRLFGQLRLLQLRAGG